MTTVTIKVIHMGEDYCNVELSTVGNNPVKMECHDLPHVLGEWLEEVGAYEGSENDK